MSPEEAAQVAEPRAEDVEEKPSVPAPRLERFIRRDDPIYDAMEFFLLLNPEEQIPMLGEPETLRGAGDAARSSGDSTSARIKYEDGAKIALYRQNKEEFRSLLRLAEEVTPADSKFAAYHRALLRGTDQAMRVAREYYKQARR